MFRWEIEGVKLGVWRKIEEERRGVGDQVEREEHVPTQLWRKKVRRGVIKLRDPSCRS